MTWHVQSRCSSMTNERGRSMLRLARCSGRCEPSNAKPELFPTQGNNSRLRSDRLLAPIVHSMPMTLWTGIRFATRVSCHRSARVWRYQSTLTTSSSSISPTLLGRARALAAEHAELSRRLNSEYDTKLAKKAGSLSAVAEALNGWEAANNVCLTYDKRQ